MHTTTPAISAKNPVLYFSQFSPPYSTLTCSQNHPYNPHQHSLPLYLNNFSPLYFCVQPSQQSAPKSFSLPQPFIQFKLHQGARELGSLVRNDTDLISLFFLKVWAVITGLTLTDSLSLRLKKLVSLWWRYLQSEWQIIQSTFSHTLNLLSLLPYPTNTITRTHIPLENSCFT